MSAIAATLKNAAVPRARALPIKKAALGGGFFVYWLPVQLVSAGPPLRWRVAKEIQATTEQGALLIAAQRGWLATPEQAADFLRLIETPAAGSQTDAAHGLDFSGDVKPLALTLPS